MESTSLRSVRYVALLAALTILAIALSVGFLLWSLRMRELNHAKLETISVARMLMAQTEQSLAGSDLVLQGVQERLMTSFGRNIALDSGPVSLLLSSRVSGLRHLRSLFIVDSKGTLINSSRRDAPLNTSVQDRTYFNVFLQGHTDRLFIDKPVRSRLDNAWTLNISRPLYEADGSLRGVVVASMDIVDFEQTYAAMQIDYARPIGIFLADGTLVASLPHRENLIGTRVPELTHETLPTADHEIRNIEHRSGDGGQEWFTLGRLAGFPLLIGVTDDVDLSLASWRETAIPIGLGALVVCIFTTLVALFLAEKLKRKAALSSALEAANDRYQHTINAAMDAIVAFDAEDRIVLFNPAAEEMFERSASQVLGQSMEMLIPARHEVQRTPVSMQSHLNITGFRADGSEFPIESTLAHTQIAGSTQTTLVFRDVTEQRRIEADLQQANMQLRALAASQQEVREQERKRISGELHDDLSQQLTGLKLSLSWLNSRMKEGRTTALHHMEDMREQLDTAITSVRRIAAEMRPRVLDDLDFGQALTWQTSEFAKYSDLKIELNLPAADLVKDEKLATALFRIVQESLTNVVRHANASSVHIGLVTDGDTLQLTIRDDGKGFAPAPRQDGIGVVGMRERCSANGANFQILSHEGRGTTVEVTVKLAPQKSQEKVL
jgi:PAS domain S-box-containing protein